MRKKLLAVIGLISALFLASVVLVIIGFGSHKHTFSEEWKYDDTNHWHESTCNHSDAVGNKEKHNFNVGVITTATTCDEDGEKTVKCVCGATKTETVETMGHAYVWETQVKGTCISVEIQEGTCSGCGITTTRELDTSDSHKWGEWKVAKESTCVTKGVEERVCELDKSHKETRELKLGQHKYVGYQITKAPTTAKEGSIKAKCTHCGKDTTLKVMRTPQISLKDAKLTWNSVKKAKGYRLYDNGQLVADLGKANSCQVSTNAGAHNYTIEAYTENVKYHNVSLKSNAVAVKIRFGNNLQTVKRTDFEGFGKQSAQLAKQWVNDCYNGSAGKVSVLKEQNNTFAKLQPATNGGVATLTKAGNPALMTAGTYTFSCDVKLGSAADGTLAFGVWDGSEWTPGWPMAKLDLTNANADGFTTVTYQFTVPRNKTVTYANLDLAYTGVKAGENNYILVDNIQFINNATGQNVDAGKNGDFESFFMPLSELLKTSGWKSDGEGDVIYVSERALENGIVTEATGNKCFKFYTSTGASTNADFAGNPKIAEAGIYKMSIKVKLGPNATKVDNIGFRFYAQNNLGTGDMTFDGLDKLNSSEWVTLETYFVVPSTVSTGYVNINYWVFTHNDEIKSADNYVLMDDIAIYPVTINGCDHEYDTYKMTTEPTATTEGVMTAKCKKAGCKEALTLKVMMTPQLTRTDAKLSWNEIPNATGYKVYDGDKVVADLVNILTYDIPLTAGAHNYTVEAYTDNADYHSVSMKSNVVKATVTVGDNLQASKGTDFEKFVEQSTIDIVKTWANGYYNGSAGKVQIMREGNNTIAKLKPAANNGAAILTRSCNVAILKAGTYKFSVDVKLGSAADGTLSFGIWDGKAWAPAWPKVTIDTTGANADGWKTVTYEFTLAANKTGTYANLDLAYTCKTAGENNYVLVDNIQMINTKTNKNADTNAYGDFEGVIASLSDMLKTNGWKQDSTGNNVIYIGSALENALGAEENGNKFFKFYTSNGASSSVDFTGNTAFAKAGTYKLSAKVQLGPDATNVDNIGFRFYSQRPLGVNDISFTGLEKLNSEEWVTLEATFTVPKRVATSYININFWVFTHNDVIKSADNYVLMDDIQVCPISITEE